MFNLYVPAEGILFTVSLKEPVGPLFNKIHSPPEAFGGVTVEVFKTVFPNNSVCSQVWSSLSSGNPERFLSPAHYVFH